MASFLDGIFGTLSFKFNLEKKAAFQCTYQHLGRCRCCVNHIAAYGVDILQGSVPEELKKVDNQSADERALRLSLA